MLEEFIEHWWLTLGRGVLIMLFGLLVLLLANNMSTTILEVLVRVSIVVLFAVYLGISGSATLLGAVLIRHTAHRWFYIAHGLLLAALALAMFLWPALRLESVIVLTATHAALNGIWELRTAVTLNHHKSDSVILLLLALASLTCATLLAIYHNGPASTATTVLGTYATLYGLCLMYFGLHLRRSKVPSIATK